MNVQSLFIGKNGEKGKKIRSSLTPKISSGRCSLKGRTQRIMNQKTASKVKEKKQKPPENSHE